MTFSKTDARSAESNKGESKSEIKNKTDQSQLPGKLGNPLCEFRRGSSKADITSIVFENKLKFLAVASTSSTVHVFVIEKEMHEQLGTNQSIGYQEEGKQQQVNSKKGGFMSGLFGKGSYMNSTTSFMQFKIKETSA